MKNIYHIARMPGQRCSIENLKEIDLDYENKRRKSSKIEEKTVQLFKLNT